jgi:hypothetical protein
LFSKILISNAFFEENSKHVFSHNEGHEISTPTRQKYNSLGENSKASVPKRQKFKSFDAVSPF